MRNWFVRKTRKTYFKALDGYVHVVIIVRNMRCPTVTRLTHEPSRYLGFGSCP